MCYAMCYVLCHLCHSEKTSKKLRSAGLSGSLFPFPPLPSPPNLSRPPLECTSAVPRPSLNKARCPITAPWGLCVRTRQWWHRLIITLVLSCWFYFIFNVSKTIFAEREPGSFRTYELAHPELYQLHVVLGVDFLNSHLLRE